MIHSIQTDNTHTWHFNRSLLVQVFFAASALFVLLVFGAQAKEPVTQIHLDESTMRKGYTAELGAMSLGIQPETFNEEASVWLRTAKNYAEYPEYLELVSDVHVYQIDVSDPQYTAKPIWLSYEYELAPEYRRQFYYYDGRLEEWVSLPTQLDTVDSSVRAAWHFPYSRIAVFDDTRYDLGPAKISGFTNFGGINAAAAIAIDDATGEVLYAKNETSKRSIASLTKLMTAYVLLQQQPCPRRNDRA